MEPASRGHLGSDGQGDLPRQRDATRSTSAPPRRRRSAPGPASAPRPPSTTTTTGRRSTRTRARPLLTRAAGDPGGLRLVRHHGAEPVPDVGDRTRSAVGPGRRTRSSRRAASSRRTRPSGRSASAAPSGARFTYRVDGVYRNYTDFYALHTNISTGQVTETQYTGKTYDLGYVGNVERPADAEVLRPPHELPVAALRLPEHRRLLDLVAHLRQHGRREHGLGPDPATASSSYPEYHDNAWYPPVGNLPQDQRHRVRLFGTWDIAASEGARAASPSASSSASTPASATAPGSATSAVASALRDEPGLRARRRSSVTYYYTARDAFRTPTV